eukprot:2179520-Pyramimonas_sp.AAC.1
MGRAPRPNLLLDLDLVRALLSGAPRTWQQSEQPLKARLKNACPIGAQCRHWRDPPSRGPGLEHARSGPPYVAAGGPGFAAPKSRRADMYSDEVNGDKIPSSGNLVPCLTDWEKMMRANSTEAVP